MLNNLFGIHEEALRIRARRAEVLAANLANADTPGYKARDFDFRALLNKQMGPTVRLTGTHARHIAGDNSMPAAIQAKYRIRYQASLRFLNGSINSLKTAIRGRSQ